MKAKQGRREQKADSPRIGRWLKRYFVKRTCRLHFRGCNRKQAEPVSGAMKPGCEHRQMTG